MQFEWDETKNRSNILKHGFDFERAKTIFDGITLVKEDARFSYDERRFIRIGKMEAVVIIVVVHTDRDGITRIISARKANKTERRDYETFIAKKH